MVLQVGFDRDMKGLEAFDGAAKGHSSILLAAQVSTVLMLGLGLRSCTSGVCLPGCMFVRGYGHQRSADQLSDHSWHLTVMQGLEELDHQFRGVFRQLQIWRPVSGVHPSTGACAAATQSGSSRAPASSRQCTAGVCMSRGHYWRPARGACSHTPAHRPRPPDL